LEHDPEKWKPVFRKDHAPTKKLDHDQIQPCSAAIAPFADSANAVSAMAATHPINESLISTSVAIESFARRVCGTQTNDAGGLLAFWIGMELIATAVVRSLDVYLSA